MIKRTPGYPCCPFIVKKIQSEDELWYYIKVFVSVCIERNVEPAIIIDDLIATLAHLSHDTNVVRPDISLLGKTASEICDSIITRADIPPYHSCTTLYKKIDSTLAGCRLCPYSSNYQNGNEQMELALFRYLLENESNFCYVTELFPREYFSSCMDVSMGIPVRKAHFFPMLNILLASMQKPNIRFLLFTPLDTSFIGQDATAFDLACEDAFQTFPSRRKVAADLKRNPMWQAALKAHIKTMIESAPVLTKEDVRNLFDNMVASQTSNISKKEPVNPIEELSVFDVEEVSSPVLLEKTTISHSQEDVREELIEKAESEVLEQPESTHVSHDVMLDNSSLEKSDITLTGNEQNIESVTASEEEQTAYIYIDDVILNSKLTQSLIDTKKILILEKEQEIPSAFYHGTLRDLTLSIEVITDLEGDYSYLMWSRHLGKFLCCKIKDTSPLLKSLLTRAKVRKLCHTPYLLYAASKLNFIPLRNVFSIHIAHNYLIKNQRVLSYKDLIKSYPTIKPYGYIIEESLTNQICPVLSGMPLYRPIHKLLNDLLDKDPAPHKLLTQMYINEAYSSSYLYALNFNMDGCTFYLSKNNEVIFHNKFLTKCKYKGQKISYYASEENSSCIKLFLYILEKLAEKGIFRKQNIQVVNMSDSVLEFFMHTDIADYVCSVIELLIFEFGKYYTKNGLQMECTKVNI